MHGLKLDRANEKKDTLVKPENLITKHLTSEVSVDGTLALTVHGASHQQLLVIFSIHFKAVIILQFSMLALTSQL